MTPDAAQQDQAVYLDGWSNRKRKVTLRFAAGIEIVEADKIVDVWSYGDVRRADGPPGAMRLSCTSGLPLARLEVGDAATKDAIVTHCALLGGERLSRTGTVRIVFWSLAAVCSIVGLAVYGIPLVADRLAPLIPNSFERRVGDAFDGQIRTMFGARVCSGADGQAAFSALVDKLRIAGEMESELEAHVLATPIKIENALALPGGRVYLFDELLQKARTPDEVAGILAHELGHVKHRDNMKRLIQTGGTSFLFGLLFGDVTGAGAVIFVSRSMLDASYSREAERSADAFAVDVMHRLGRSPAPMGELLFRITGAQAKGITILASHPLTEERLETMKRENRANTGPPLLSDVQWRALRNICK